MPWHTLPFYIPFVAGITTIYIYRDKLPRGLKRDD